LERHAPGEDLMDVLEALERAEVMLMRLETVLQLNEEPVLSNSQLFEIVTTVNEIVGTASTKIQEFQRDSLDREDYNDLLMCLDGYSFELESQLNVEGLSEEDKEACNFILDKIDKLIKKMKED
jgi:hypothetical protein